MADINPNEEAVIGVFLGANELAVRAIGYAVGAGIRVEWFSDPVARLVVDAILDLWRRNKHVDVMLLDEELTAGGKESRIAFLNHCLSAYPSVYHFPDYLEKVQDAYVRRQLAELIIEAGYAVKSQTDVPALDLAADIQGRFFRLIGQKSDGRPLAEIAEELIASWEHPDEKQKAETSWPLASIQGLIGNLNDEYVILASQPSVGKTALALQIAVHNAEHQHRVSFASLESRRLKIVQRLIALMGSCHTLSMRRGLATEGQFESAREVAERLKTLPLQVTDDSMTVEQLRAWALREKSNGARLLIVDNMRHVRANRDFKNRFDMFAALSSHLKNIRDDTGLPLIVLHHLSADDKLSWSADIERDADIVLIMAHNEEESIIPSFGNHWCGRWIVDIECKKNREGQIGKITVEFDKRIQKFLDRNVASEVKE
ncbi:MAG: DnaB-like helicase C-terminal domain-containing protein [Kiritimatiellia bacterium]|nr:DnaB-like helicase C-terminal domain-containing protein [Kiritimatiellia bacterium]